MAMSTDRPTAVGQLDVNEVKDGLIVYDPVSDRVHHLNATAAIVFTLCDGRTDAPAMADVMAATFDLDTPPLVEVQKCLRSLAAEGLLE
jgi:hypothetical protein